MVRVLPTERLLGSGNESSALSDSRHEQPPVIKRTEIVAIALVVLTAICVTGVLYVARGFFLPIVMAFVVGTMLSPAANFLERYRVPRSVGAVLIVIAVAAGLAFIIGLISAPVLDWTNRLPELATQLKAKLHVFDRPIALWHEMQTAIGGGSAQTSSLELPKFDWVQPTIEFLSPTFTEFLLFFATLVLFIASWR
ncbi:AI-2E family transporter, partial [Bradyrhizobium oligotrophicum]